MNKTEPPITKDYLTIVALEDGLTAKLSLNACEYCVDGDGNWKSLPPDTETEVINAGHTLSFRANLTPTTNVGIGTFTVKKFHNLKGDCMSLLVGDEAEDCVSLSNKQYAFCRLFRNNTNVVSAAELLLPATDLSTGCYLYMFSGCSSLIDSPVLPAMKSTNSCYAYMFNACTSLTTAPELPATTLATKCYMYMFCGCSKLTKAPELPATIALNECYRAMFEVCTALKTAPELPATTLANNCYQSMFNSCTSLTTAPSLPATTLASGCYQTMFRLCRLLTSAPELFATVLVKDCYQKMFWECYNLNYIKMLATDISAENCLLGFTYNVAANGTFVKSKDATWDEAEIIPNGWTVISE